MKTTKCGFDQHGPIGPRLLIATGPTLQVSLGFDQTYLPTSGKPPTLPFKDLQALVDTGATESCIDSTLAAILALPVIDQRQVGGVGGSMTVNMHLAHIYVPSLDHVLSGAFAGVHLMAGGQPHQVLLGRTFLQYFTMKYDGHTGMVSISEPPKPPVP